MRSALRLLSAAILGLLCAVSVFPQASQTGGITGVVSDASGALISGATVDVINESTGKSERTVTTASDGGYSITLLKPGGYRLEITAPNFKKAVVTAVQVRIGETARQDVTLEAGRIEETVNVEATTSLINPSSAVTGQPLTAETLRTLPLASPNFLFLMSLSAGTASEPTDVRTAGRGTADMNVNGQRTTNNSISLEGINVNDFNLAHFDTVPLPNPSTLEEMKVSTSLYDASQGSKGGGAMGLVIKSGSKDYHWEGYWSHRNDALTPTSISATRPASANAPVCCRTCLAVVVVVQFRRLVASGSLTTREFALATVWIQMVRVLPRRFRISPGMLTALLP